MFINKLELFDYRGITHLELQFKPGVNLIVGVNGMGKSSILDALAILMSGFIRRVENAEKKSRKFVESDIANDNSAMMTSIELTYEDEIIKWSSARKSNKNIKNLVADAVYRSELSQLNEVTNKIHERVVNQIINRDSTLSLPIAVAYDVNRAVVDPPILAKGLAEIQLFDVYDQALEQKSGADFNGFFKWFRKLEDIENEKIRDNHGYRIKELNTVFDTVIIWDAA